jgi:Aminoacyl-tRNA editing domain
VVLIVASGTSRMDNKKVKALFGGKPKMLGVDEVAAITGHEVGGVCPFGLKTPLPVYCDAGPGGPASPRSPLAPAEPGAPAIPASPGSPFSLRSPFDPSKHPASVTAAKHMTIAIAMRISPSPVARKSGAFGPDVNIHLTVMPLRTITRMQCSHAHR